VAPGGGAPCVAPFPLKAPPPLSGEGGAAEETEEKPPGEALPTEVLAPPGLAEPVACDAQRRDTAAAAANGPAINEPIDAARGSIEGAADAAMLLGRLGPPAPERPRNCF